MNVKHDNFIRIASNRTKKIVDMIRSLQNFSNTSFYEYSNNEVDTLFAALNKELSNTERVLKEANAPKIKKREL